MNTNGNEENAIRNREENGDISRKAKLSFLIREMIEILNPNADIEIKTKTPDRFSDALLEFTQGYQDNALEIISDAVFDSEGFDDMIIVKDINFNSMCEHHMLPFFGDCTIGYIPNKKILGLSKFPRLVQTVSKKMHIQERLNKEIADILNKVLTPKGIVVMLSSIHSCMCFRGIKSNNAKTDSIYTLGNLKEKENLDKFFNILRK